MYILFQTIGARNKEILNNTHYHIASMVYTCDYAIMNEIRVARPMHGNHVLRRIWYLYTTVNNC